MNANLVYLNHINDAINKIEGYIKGVSYETFSNNEMMIDAVVRELEIVGEAGGNISDKFKKDHPEIPWSKMIGMRNRLIHEYFGLNKNIVWETCETDLKDLKKLIQSLIASKN